MIGALTCSTPYHPQVFCPSTFAQVFLLRCCQRSHQNALSRSRSRRHSGSRSRSPRRSGSPAATGERGTCCYLLQLVGRLDIGSAGRTRIRKEKKEKKDKKHKKDKKDKTARAEKRGKAAGLALAAANACYPCWRCSTGVVVDYLRL